VGFSLTDEQRHLRRSVREFAESEIAPHKLCTIGEGTRESQRLVIARQLLGKN
jgi:alkylation response protein AidB-like acyl-CoA dehydrogenase